MPIRLCKRSGCSCCSRSNTSVSLPLQHAKTEPKKLLFEIITEFNTVQRIRLLPALTVSSFWEPGSGSAVTVLKEQPLNNLIPTFLFSRRKDVVSHLLLRSSEETNFPLITFRDAHPWTTWRPLFPKQHLLASNLYKHCKHHIFDS